MHALHNGVAVRQSATIWLDFKGTSGRDRVSACDGMYMLGAASVEYPDTIKWVIMILYRLFAKCNAEVVGN